MCVESYVSLAKNMWVGEGKLYQLKQLKLEKTVRVHANLDAPKISAEERQNIFDDFYKLSQNEKYHFYGRTTEKIDKQRC